VKPWKWALAGAAGAVAAELLVRSRKPWPAPKRHFTAAEDGRRLALDEYPPESSPKGTVYLQHGLGSRSNTFDLHPHGPSFARWLARRGWRVFLGSVRGRETGNRFDWKFSDFLLRDAPALARSVRTLAGEPFHWIGHSLGGILGLGYAAHFGGKDLASLTTIGSALHYGVGRSRFSDINELDGIRETLGKRKKVWNELYHRLAAPFAALGLLPGRLLYNRANMRAGALLAFHGHTMADISVPVLFELASTFEGDGIECSELGRRLPEVAKSLPVRWHAVAGSRDAQCPPETARWTFDRVEAPEKRWRLVEDFGHVDLVCGEDAEPRVWRPIEDFLLS
jgi:pimeloyl-ACP methyl ester carboxylesterase